MTKLCALAVLACLIGADSLELPQLSRRTALAAAVALPAPAFAKIDYGDAAPKAESHALAKDASAMGGERARAAAARMARRWKAEEKVEDSYCSSPRISYVSTRF